MRYAFMNNLSGTYGDNQPWQNPELWKKLRNYALDGIIFDPRDVNVNDTCLSYFRDRAVLVGLNRNPNESHYDPLQLATLQSDDLNRLGQNGKQCFLLANIEYPYRGSYIITWLENLTQLRPGRFKYWGVEGYQGGWIKSTTLSVGSSTISLVNVLNTTGNFKSVLAESYDGWMTDYSPDTVRNNLLSTGLDPAKAAIYYDGAKQIEPHSPFNGVVFTFERLP